MKKLIKVAAIVAVGALFGGAEMLYGTLSGTNTQTLTVGPGSSRLALQCTTAVRYRVSQGAADTVTADDALIAIGDPYIIEKPTSYDRLNVAHSDTTSAISCSVFRRVP